MINILNEFNDLIDWALTPSADTTSLLGKVVEIIQKIDLSDEDKKELIHLNGRHANTLREVRLGIIDHIDKNRDFNQIHLATVSYILRVKNDYERFQYKNATSSEQKIQNEIQIKETENTINLIEKLQSIYRDNYKIISKNFPETQLEIEGLFKKKEFWDTINDYKIWEFKANFEYLRLILDKLDGLKVLANYYQENGYSDGKKKAENIRRVIDTFKKDITFREAEAKYSVAHEYIKNYDKSRALSLDYHKKKVRFSPPGSQLEEVKDPFLEDVLKPFWNSIKDKTPVDFFTFKVPQFNILVVIITSLLVIYTLIRIINKI